MAAIKTKETRADVNDFINAIADTDQKRKAQDGKTKSLRQWRFKSKNEIDENRILEYIIEAIEVEKKVLSKPAYENKASKRIYC